MRTSQKRKMKTRKIELLIIVLVSIFLVISFAKFLRVSGFEVIVATVVPAEQAQPTLTGTVLTPAATTIATTQVPKDSNPPAVNLTAPVKYLDLEELVPLDCQASDDTKVRFTTIKITSPSGSVSNFVSEYSSNNLSFRVTEVGNYSFICTAEDTSNNAADSVRYLLPVVNKSTQTSSASVTTSPNVEIKTSQNESVEQTLQTTSKENKTITISVPEKNFTLNETANKTAVNATAEPLLVQLVKRFLEFFVRSK